MFDTHTYLFAIGNSEQMSSQVREVRKKRRTASRTGAFYQEHLRNLRATVLAIDAHHSFELVHLPLLHKDPFDRLLISQARVENMTLLSRDESIRRYPVTTLW